MPKIELIIFDFDGVIVDSEALSSAVHAQTLQQIGVPLTHADIDKHYTGLDFASMMQKISAEHGDVKAAAFAATIEANYAQIMRNELQLMPHIFSFLQTTKLKFCIGSNSKMQRLKTNQQATNIDAIFANKTFSADMVANPKPAPDLFLYAAEKMAVSAKNCVVIEDGAHGIKAASTAGMKSIGFVGGSHCNDGHAQRLLDAGALQVFSDMRELPKIINNL
ncbi:MAG: HAD family phosphatase [Rhizobiales bacterium]|nr:HAD family phosphatase [Hyphomicrobiales bacterium]NRB14670.1 HAD family phosphatase [Hyphomicrobiales bacterium]